MCSRSRSKLFSLCRICRQDQSSLNASLVKVTTMPIFRWDEAMLKHGRRSSDFYTIPPGPRNPVGIVWIGVNKKGIGIHGTDSPDTIGRSASHGCIRLANWDAARVVNQVTVGMTV